MEDVAIETPYIQLDQLLKRMGDVPSGGAVKMLLAAGCIRCNGATETARRRKLYADDTVEVKGGGSYRIVRV